MATLLGSVSSSPATTSSSPAAKRTLHPGAAQLVWLHQQQQQQKQKNHHADQRTAGSNSTPASPRQPRRGSLDSALPWRSARAVDDAAAEFAELQARWALQHAKARYQVEVEAADMAQHACLGSFPGLNGTARGSAGSDSAGSTLTDMGMPQGMATAAETRWPRTTSDTAERSPKEQHQHPVRIRELRNYTRGSNFDFAHMLAMSTILPAPFDRAVPTHCGAQCQKLFNWGHRCRVSRCDPYAPWRTCRSCWMLALPRRHQLDSSGVHLNLHLASCQPLEMFALQLCTGVPVLAYWDVTYDGVATFQAVVPCSLAP